MTAFSVANLPRIPWNVTWSAEEKFEVRPCRWADMRRAIWQPHRPGVGAPIYKKPHNVRQRMGVQKMLCSHCGLPTAKGKRWWFGLGRFIDEGYYTTVDLPMHKECADLSLKMCPVLRSYGDEPMPWPEGAVIMFQIVGGPKVTEDFGIVSSPDNPVVGHLKFAWPESHVKFKVREIAA